MSISGTMVFFLILGLSGLILLGAVLVLRPAFGRRPHGASLKRSQQSPQWRHGAFHNIHPTPMLTSHKPWWELYFGFLYQKEPSTKSGPTVPPIPLVTVKTDLKALSRGLAVPAAALSKQSAGGTSSLDTKVSNTIAPVPSDKTCSVPSDKTGSVMSDSTCPVPSVKICSVKSDTTGTVTSDKTEREASDQTTEVSTKTTVGASGLARVGSDLARAASGQTLAASDQAVVGNGQAVAVKNQTLAPSELRQNGAAHEHQVGGGYQAGREHYLTGSSGDASKAGAGARADVLVWLGHSSLYLQQAGLSILVDPVLTAEYPALLMMRPFPGTAIYSPSDIPPIDLLLITHDHWDHLDYGTIKRIRPLVKQVICPLGVGEHLRAWGYPDAQITELDWGESYVIGQPDLAVAQADSAIGRSAPAVAQANPAVAQPEHKSMSDGNLQYLRVYCLPARHFSGRLFKRNTTLWASYLVETIELASREQSGVTRELSVANKEQGTAPMPKPDIAGPDMVKPELAGHQEAKAELAPELAHATVPPQDLPESMVVRKKVFISGDSGYDTHFSEIYQRFGVVDLAIMENGQYSDDWSLIHMRPHDLIKALNDLSPRYVLTYHHSKYSLAPHAWDEPMRQITAYALAHGAYQAADESNPVPRSHTALAVAAKEKVATEEATAEEAAKLAKAAPAGPARTKVAATTVVPANQTVAATATNKDVAPTVSWQLLTRKIGEPLWF